MTLLGNNILWGERYFAGILMVTSLGEINHVDGNLNSDGEVNLVGGGISWRGELFAEENELCWSTVVCKGLYNFEDSVEEKNPRKL